MPRAIAQSLYLPGVSGAYASAPDRAEYDWSTGLYAAIRLSTDDWTAASSQALISQNLLSGNQRSWAFFALNTGGFSFVTSSNGSSDVYNNTVGAALSPFADGAGGWLAFTFEPNVGGQARVRSWWAADQDNEPSSWTMLNERASAAAHTLFNSTAPIEIGSYNGGLNPFAGKVYRAILRNSMAGTKLFDADFTKQPVGTSSFTEDANGATVTINGNARITGRQLTDAGLYLPGTTGNYPAVPSSAATNITTDFDLRCEIRALTYLPAVNNILHYFGGDKILFTLTNGGFLRIQYYDTSVTLRTFVCTVALNTAVKDNARVWVRATADVDNGSGGATVKFYTSTNGTAWTQLGADVTVVGASGVRDVTSAFRFGEYSGALLWYKGQVYKILVYSDLTETTKVMDIDFTAQLPGTLSFTEATGKTVTVTSSGTYPAIARITGARQAGVGLYLPGISGNYVATPDSAVLDITGDIDIRADVTADDWTSAVNPFIFNKEGTGTAGGYHLRILSTGIIRLGWSTGAAALTLDSSVAVPAGDGQRIWIRATLDVNDGSGNRVAKFYTSTDGSTWSQLGATATVSGTTSIGVNAVELRMGAFGGGNLFSGIIHRLIIKDGIDGTSVFDADFAQPTMADRVMAESANGAILTLIRTGFPYASFTRRAPILKGLDNRTRTNGNYASIPDANYLDITDDMEMMWYGVLDYMSFAHFTNEVLMGKDSPSTSQRSYLFYHTVSGTLGFITSPNGTTGSQVNATSTVTIQTVASPGLPIALKVTRRISDGRVQFFTADTPAGPWTQLGADRTNSTAAHSASTSTFAIGGRSDGQEPVIGTTYRAWLKNGIDGTTLVDADFTAQTPGATSFTESSSNAATVTINSAGSVPARIVGIRQLIT